MKKEKLTATQQLVLNSMPVGVWTCAYELKCNLSTLQRLADKGTIDRRLQVGAHFSPRTNIEFRRKDAQTQTKPTN